MKTGSSGFADVMITDVLHIPDARRSAALAHLRRWRDDFGGLLEAERERWLIRY